MGGVNIQQLFDDAARQHQAGQLREAERAYRQVLQAQPAHADALHMLGVVNAQLGNYDAAAALIRRAIEISPANAGYHANLGNVLQESGQLDDAVAAYGRAIALAPNLAEVYNNLANALQHRGDIEQAVSAYERATTLRPDFPEAHFNRGNALQKLQRSKDAIAAYRQALALRPSYAEAHLHLGMALIANADVEVAIDAYRRALALREGFVEAHANLGRALLQVSRQDEAIAAFRRALILRPNQPDVEHELGNALREAGKLDEAIAAYQRSLATRPDFADSHFGLAWTYLLKGDFERGWAEYEWRSGLRDAALWARHLAEPRWDGAELHGRRILLHAEQGFGDTFLAFRYVPMVLARSGRVVLQCPRPMLGLLGGQRGIEQAIEDGQPPPAIDVQCPLMSLPGVFATTLATIPADVPYIFAEPGMIEQWRERLGKPQGLQVGLVWSGKPAPANRSVALEALAPLAGIGNVRWHSLQVGDAAAAARTPPPGMELLDWSDRLTDFAQTAALIANLDLVITIDTAVAHLAGAMGKPLWVMLQYVPDWRWLLHRSDSPWYPTMRLFRQPRPGDWGAVASQIATALRSLLERQ
ncbi:MAG TPA: tetratricopeptide repeat protein [Tepidisphaeraceae bacterium]|nr:tetratricopeptide repeat protein [Tepidisphaeraceae bacterium]